MEIRRSENRDIPEILALYEAARAALKAAGVDQWQNGYPTEADVRRDMDGGVSFVLEDNGAILATACLAFGREPTYDRVFDGGWAADPEVYGFLHRIAVAPAAKGKGVAGLMFDELKRRAREAGVTVIRGDTHRDNLPMQRVMAKNGLEYRGIIYLNDGSERLAYECIMTD